MSRRGVRVCVCAGLLTTSVPAGRLSLLREKMKREQTGGGEKRQLSAVRCHLDFKEQERGRSAFMAPLAPTDKERRSARKH